jgi:DMSO/TMAO reductase YedYZ molybdopterin-dependent catalytic subunit
LSEEKRPQPVPPGQKYIKSFIYYAALGVPEVNIEAYRLRVTGNVKTPRSFTYNELEQMTQIVVDRDFHCVTSWSVAGTRWEGPALKDVVSSSDPLQDTEWVMFRCLDGYTTPIPYEDAVKEESVLALRLNGKKLSLEMGYPVRPFVPHLYGWKSAKWLTEITLLKEYEDGYWEERGYNERGNIWEEERFKSWGKHLRRTVIGR